jgi:hypothetical protein
MAQLIGLGKALFEDQGELAEDPPLTEVENIPDDVEPDDPDA